MVTGIRVTLLGGLLAAAGALASPVDLVVVNGSVYTANAGRQQAEAFAVRGDIIEAVGSSQDMLALAGQGTRIVDLEGRRAIPGLHDAHIHTAGIVRYEGCNLDSRALDLPDLASFVAECVERLQPEEGEWLSVRQWAFAAANRPGKGLANIRQALDKAAPKNPVMLLGNDGHHYATNSLGLARATDESGKQVGLSRSTLASDFQAYRHYVGVDEQGEPNGAVNESTPALLGSPNLLTADLDLIIAEAGQVPGRLAALGITSIQEAAFVPELIPLYNALLATEGGLPLRIRLAQLFPPQIFADEKGVLDMNALLAAAGQVRDLYRDQPNIRADALKFFVDGVLEGNPLEVPPTLPNAAALNNYHQPLMGLDGDSGKVSLRGYVDVDGEACSNWRGNPGEVQQFMDRNGFHPGQCRSENGVLASPREQALQFVAAADAAGYAVHLHAIGDRAVRVAIDAVEQVTRPGVMVNRHSMAHLQLVADQEIRRLGELKIPLAMTYAWAAANPEYDMTIIPFVEKLEDEEDLYNPESYYYRHFYPVASIRDSGGILAAGSDAPVESDDPRPFVNIQAAVTRDMGTGVFNTRERLGILDAIDAYTINGARLMGQADVTGSIEPGKKADFIVLDQDIIELAMQGKIGQINQTAVLQTWFDGRQIYGEKL